MLVDKTLTEFNNVLASSAPVPGGGGVSALVSALGAGLGVMVGALTVGKKKYAAVEPQIKELCERAAKLQDGLLSLVDEDALCFEPLSRVYSMPKDAPGRDELMEKSLVSAASVPLKIARCSAEAISLMSGFAEMGSVLAISDAGCGAAFCKAALEGAALNVYVNTRLMKDRAVAENINSEVASLVGEYSPMADAVYRSVLNRLK